MPPCKAMMRCTGSICPASSQLTIGRRCTMGMTAYLVALAFGSGLHPVGAAGVHADTSILFENAGNHVLTALLAFMLGVVLTAVLLCIRKRE